MSVDDGHGVFLVMIGEVDPVGLGFSEQTRYKGADLACAQDENSMHSSVPFQKLNLAEDRAPD